MRNQNAFDAFYVDQTPANAVRLAVEDSISLPLKDWPFIDALRKAEKQLESHDDLLAALRDVDNKIRAMQGNPHWEAFAQEAQGIARSAIAKATS